jgi:hypothetical protein
MEKQIDKTNEQIACNNWEKIGILKERARIKEEIEKTHLDFTKIKQGNKLLTKKQIIEGASIIVLFKQELLKSLGEKDG